MAAPTLNLLVVEDEPRDFETIAQAVQRSGFDVRLQWSHDGREAIEYLQGAGRFVDRVEFPLPDILLVDLRMPRLSGLDFLRWTQSNPKYRVIPTMVMSSSAIPGDVEQAYHLGANAYFLKPADPEIFVQVFKYVVGFWSLALTPSRARRSLPYEPLRGNAGLPVAPSWRQSP